MSKVVYDSTRRMNCYLVKGKITFPSQFFGGEIDKATGYFTRDTKFGPAMEMARKFEEKGVAVLINEDSVSAGLEHIYEAVWATVSPVVPRIGEKGDVGLRVNSFEFMGDIVVPFLKDEDLHFSYKLYPSDLSNEEQLRRIGYLSKKFTLSQTEARTHLAETDWVVVKAEEKIIREAAALKAGESQAHRSGGFEG
jgi:hypothetical protein